MGRCFCPFELAAVRFVMIVLVVFVIGMAATAAAFVVTSIMGINCSVEMCVEFSKMLGIMGDLVWAFRVVIHCTNIYQTCYTALTENKTYKQLHTNDGHNNKCLR